MSQSIDVAMLPAEAQRMAADCYVVIDVLRATTTIAALFGGGLRSLLAVSDLALARDRAAAEGRLLFGEVGGLPPEGFDFGNSPVDASIAPVEGRDAVLFTTNGTAALCAFPGTATVITGAFANLSAVSSFAARFERVVLVCAGNSGGTRFSLEDFLGAGAIANALLQRTPGATKGDGALAALVASGHVDLGIGDSNHAGYTASIGLAGDVAFSAKRDSSNAVPRIVRQGAQWALLKDASREP